MSAFRKQNNLWMLVESVSQSVFYQVLIDVSNEWCVQLKENV